MHLLATYSLFRPCLFGSISRVGPWSTAEARKLPSTVDAIMVVKLIWGCSMASALYKMSDADFVDPYNDRVGAGTSAARLEIRSMDGAVDVAFSIGICGPYIRIMGSNFQASAYKCYCRDKRASVIASQCGIGDVDGMLDTLDCGLASLFVHACHLEQRTQSRDPCGHHNGIYPVPSLFKASASNVGDGCISHIPFSMMSLTRTMSAGLAKSATTVITPPSSAVDGRNATHSALIFSSASTCLLTMHTLAPRSEY
jgi:hypothetical protein